MKLFGYKVTWQRNIEDDNGSKENVCLEYNMNWTFENNFVSVDTTDLFILIQFHLNDIVSTNTIQYYWTRYDTV